MEAKRKEKRGFHHAVRVADGRGRRQHGRDIGIGLNTPGRLIPQLKKLFLHKKKKAAVFIPVLILHCSRVAFVVLFRPRRSEKRPQGSLCSKCS